MSSETNVAFAKENLQAFVKKDWDRYKSMFSENAVFEEKCTGRRTTGPTAITQLNQGWSSAFPDVTCSIRSAFGSGNSVILEVTWEGTHTGKLGFPNGSLEASGRRAKVDAVLVASFEKGKLSSVRHYFDMMTLLRQIGLPAESRKAA